MKDKEVHRARIIHSELGNSYTLQYKLYWFSFWTVDQTLHYDPKPIKYIIHHMNKDTALKHITDRYDELLGRTIIKDSKDSWVYC